MSISEDRFESDSAEPGEGSDQDTALRASLLDRSEYPAWDEFVHRHPLGCAYHGTGWLHFLERQFAHIAGEVLVVRSAGSSEILAGIPVYTASSILLGKRLISAPFATLGGFLSSSGAAAGVLRQALEDLADERRGRGIRVRGVSEGVGTIFGGHWSRQCSFLHHFLDLSKEEGDLRRGFTKGVKHSLARARKAGLQVEADCRDSTLREFSDLLAASRKRLRLPAMPEGFLRRLFECLPEDSRTLLVARRGTRMLGGLVELGGTEWAIYEHVADTPEGRSAGVNHQLLWQSIQNARARGCRWYSFGRTAPGRSGLRQFKRAWGAEEETLDSYVYPGRGEADLREEASFVRKAISFGFGITPEPVRMLVSKMIYKHWA